MSIFSATVHFSGVEYAVLSCTSAHPPILTVLWFFKVLRVTAHHAKFSRSESEGT